MKDIMHFNDDWLDAKKSRDKVKDSCLGMFHSACVNNRIEIGRQLTTDEAISVLRKQIKQIKESLEFAKRANRPDLIDKHTREISILEEYLPEEMSIDKIKNIVSGVVTPNMNKGQAMKAAMAVLRGKADGRIISEVVNGIING